MGSQLKLTVTLTPLPPNGKEEKKQRYPHDQFLIALSIKITFLRYHNNCVAIILNQVVWNVHANHAGGYSYRLCKVPSEGIVGLTEECFQQTPLEFKGKDQWVRAEGQKKWTKKRAMQTTVGTWPQGSMWRKNHYFTYGTCMEHVDCTKKEELGGKNCGRCRGQIKDEVKVPANLTPGAYVLSWRWDAEGSGQIWSGCANIEIA